MKRELIATKPVSEFGETDPSLGDMGDGKIDLTYTPGWSELRKRRDEEVAEWVGGTRHGKDVMVLPGNLRLVRRTSVSGELDGKKSMAAHNTGGRLVTSQDIGQPWFTAMPPGAKALLDGTIVNAAGDCQYMWWEAPQAAARKQRNEHNWLEASGAQIEKGADISGEGMKFHDIEAQDGGSIVDRAPSKGRTKS